MIDDGSARPHRFVNLYVYSDSLAFPRREGPHDLAATYPFKLRELIEQRLGIRANVLFRGSGGAEMRRVTETLVRDCAYIGGHEGACNVAVFQFGIVDCAPRPITYMLLPALRRIPVVGGRVIVQLKLHRKMLQNLWSYTLTPMERFRSGYARIVNECRRVQLELVAVGMPLPPVAMEERSPGFRHNTEVYNALIRAAAPDRFCDIEAGMSEDARAKLLLPDGHHLTEEGHEYYAERLFENVKTLLSRAAPAGEST